MGSDPLLGQTLGTYEIIQRLGKGGMATVYRARQATMARDVAVKVMSADLAEDPKFVARFEQEAKVIANLQHPRILPVHDFGHEGDLFYLVMRVIEGESLYHRMLHGKLPLMTTAKYVAQIAEALDYAHAQSIIHRDLKPNNVLIDEWDNCYLMDFGLAKLLAATQSLTQTGAVLGTPAYMAPEQWRGEGVDARTDIYALGIILYEMVLGHPPFEDDTPFTLMYKHINEMPPSPTAEMPELPDEIEAIILTALAKEREQRFQSAGDLAQEFMSVARVAGSLVARERQEDSLERTAGEGDAVAAGVDLQQPAAEGEVAVPGAPPDAPLPAPDLDSLGEAPPVDEPSEILGIPETPAAPPAEVAADVPPAFPADVKADVPPDVPAAIPAEAEPSIPLPMDIAPPPPPIPVPGRSPGARPAYPAPRASGRSESESRLSRALEMVDQSIEAVVEKAAQAVPPLSSGVSLLEGEPPSSAAPINAPAFITMHDLIPADDTVVGVLDVRGTAKWKTWKRLLFGGLALFLFGGITGAGFFSFLGIVMLGYLGFECFRTYRGDVGRFYLGFTPQRVIVLPRDAYGHPRLSKAWVVPWDIIARLRLTDRYVLLDIATGDMALNFGALLLAQGEGGLGAQLHWLPDSPVVRLIEDWGFETRNLL